MEAPEAGGQLQAEAQQQAEPVIHRQHLLMVGMERQPILNKEEMAEMVEAQAERLTTEAVAAVAHKNLLAQHLLLLMLTAERAEMGHQPLEVMVAQGQYQQYLGHR
jgi:hypothetical protein